MNLKFIILRPVTFTADKTSLVVDLVLLGYLLSLEDTSSTFRTGQRLIGGLDDRGVSKQSW